jgi:hypothetical protein
MDSCLGWMSKNIIKTMLKKLPEKPSSLSGYTSLGSGLTDSPHIHFMPSVF